MFTVRDRVVTAPHSQACRFLQPISGQGPVEAKTMREARAKAVIANEEDAVKSARAAAEFKPALDEMTNAYEALVKAGGIGPIQGSQYGRQFQAITGLGCWQ